jgi:hypothetical protein
MWPLSLLGMSGLVMGTTSVRKFVGAGQKVSASIGANEIWFIHFILVSW